MNSSQHSPEPKSGPPVPDFRGFIQALDDHGFLKRIRDPADWRLDVGKISQQHNSPCLFEAIKEYPDWKLFTGGCSQIPCIAMALGLDPATPLADLVLVLRKRMDNPLPPTILDAIHANTVAIGGDVNLGRLPVPRWNEIDAGRYVGTWHINITRNPQTGARNIGVYRMQILNENQTSLSVSPKSHLARHMEIAERAGRPLEMAVAIGIDEPIVMAAAAALPFDADEFSVAGAWMQRPVELAKCRTIALEVPANAEVVLEGKILPGRRVTDGPYMDYAGIPSTNPNAWLFEVSAISWRDKPIFRGMAVGKPGAEDHQLFVLLSKLGLLDFHGSRIRQSLQRLLIARKWFRPFQWTGRLGLLKKRLKPPSQSAAPRR